MKRLPGVYYAATWGEPIEGGSTGVTLAELWAYAKQHRPDDSPFVVANEYAAHRVGTQIGLPIPPGGIVGDGGTLGFASLAFRTKGASSPPVIPADLVASDERLAAGVVVLDIIVMNTDRHEENLAYGGRTQRLEVFDHSHCLFGNASTRDAGLAHITHLSNRLVIDGDLAGRTVAPHCLMDELLDATHLLHWCNEARQVLTDSFIANLCSELVDVHLLPDQACGNTLRDVLILRRERLREIIREHQTSHFLGIDPRSWRFA